MGSVRAASWSGTKRTARSWCGGPVDSRPRICTGPCSRKGAPKPQSPRGAEERRRTVHQGATCAPLTPTVLVRLATRDDAETGRGCRRLRRSGRVGLVPLLLAEAVWVLSAVYDLLPAEIATAVQMLLNHKDSDHPGCGRGCRRPRPLSETTSSWDFRTASCSRWHARPAICPSARSTVETRQAGGRS